MTKIRNAIVAHKIWTAIIVLIIITVGYFWYRNTHAASTTPQYVLSRARIGSITQTVTGTGQVSSSNQIDVQSLVSGTINSINVKVGDHVYAGQLLATLDSRQAALNLENARLSLSKLTQPPKSTDLSNAQNSLVKSYDEAFNSISTFFIDSPVIITGLKDLLYGRGTFLSDQESFHLISSARIYRDDAAKSYDSLSNNYEKLQLEYKNITRSSATSSIETLLEHTLTVAKEAAVTLQKTQTATNYITTVQSDYKASDAATTATNVNTWSTKINGDLGDLLASKNTIESSANALTNLVNGSDQLDIASQRLALQQQEQTYQNYFIKAPFSGVVGRIPVSTYQQAGNGTIIATIIGDQKIATISLNEVDAAKVKVGNKVNITFDALSDLNASGIVSEVDLVGTVTQGVVTYNVKIVISTSDPRILPGMSVNTTIVTKQVDNVLVVPSTAVKTERNTTYIQVFDTIPAGSTSTPSQTGTATLGTNNRTFGTGSNNFASSTNSFNRNTSGTNVGSSTSRFEGGLGSTTRTFDRTGVGTQTGLQNRTITITTDTLPRDQVVTIGAADDNNTEILSGISSGAWIVTRTINAANAQTSTAPSILNTLGGNRSGAGGGGNATFRAR